MVRKQNGPQPTGPFLWETISLSFDLRIDGKALSETGPAGHRKVKSLRAGKDAME